MSIPEPLEYRSPERPNFRAAILVTLCAVVAASGFGITFWVVDQAAPREAKVRTDYVTRTGKSLGNTKLALATFEVEHEHFPTTAEGLQILATDPGNIPDWHAYLERLPLDDWCRPFVYRYPGTRSGFYDLYSLGPDGKDGTADDIWDGE